MVDTQRFGSLYMVKRIHDLYAFFILSTSFCEAGKVGLTVPQREMGGFHLEYRCPAFWTRDPLISWGTESDEAVGMVKQLGIYWDIYPSWELTQPCWVDDFPNLPWTVGYVRSLKGITYWWKPGWPDLSWSIFSLKNASLSSKILKSEHLEPENVPLKEDLIPFEFPEVHCWRMFVSGTRVVLFRWQMTPPMVRSSVLGSSCCCVCGTPWGEVGI